LTTLSHRHRFIGPFCRVAGPFIFLRLESHLVEPCAARRSGSETGVAVCFPCPLGGQGNAGERPERRSGRVYSAEGSGRWAGAFAPSALGPSHAINAPLSVPSHPVGAVSPLRAGPQNAICFRSRRCRGFVGAGGPTSLGAFKAMRHQGLLPPTTLRCRRKPLRGDALAEALLRTRRRSFSSRGVRDRLLLSSRSPARRSRGSGTLGAGRPCGPAHRRSAVRSGA